MPELIERGKVADFLSSVECEDEHFEAKSAANNIPRNAWETMSAFANTGGGVILFGVSETAVGFEATGVSDSERLRHDLQTGLRNRRKINLEVSGNQHIWVEAIDGHDVLVMVVPEANRANKPVYLGDDTDLAYLRRGEADVQCDTTELKRLLRESQPQAADSDVIDYLDFPDLDTKAVRRYRLLCAENGSRHLRDEPDDREFLTRIGVWRNDRESRREGLTRGGVLMFGSELAIREVRPDHVIDYRLQDSPEAGMRWRDRVRWTGHLFGAWEEITPRLIRSLPVPFRLSGTTRRDEPAGEETIREAFINLLIHTDYLELSDARIIVTGDGFLFDNPGNSRVRVESSDYDAPEHFPPSERRNPLLSSFFAQANLAELAGSGVRSMRSEWRSLGYQAPRFHNSVEEHRFSVLLNLRSMIGKRDREWLELVGGPWTENEEYALLLAREAERVDNQQLREIAGLHPADATRVLQGLKDKGALIQNGYGKGTYYRLSGPRTTLAQLNIDLEGANSKPDSPHEDTTSPRDKAQSMGDSSESLRDLRESLGDSAETLMLLAADFRSQRYAAPEALQNMIVALCMIKPLGVRTITELLGRKSSDHIRAVIRELVRDDRLQMEHPDQPRHPRQRYLAPTLPESAGDT